MSEFYSPYTAVPDNLVYMILAIYIAVVGIGSIIGIVEYILRGLAIYRMSENRGIANGWLGFIPFARTWQFGNVAGEIQLGKKKIVHTGRWLLLLPIVSTIITYIMMAVVMTPFISQIIATASDIGDYSYDGQMMVETISEAMPSLIGSGFIVGIITLLISALTMLLRGLVLHKIFSQYSAGQKPVLYMILSLFVPYCETIFLFVHRDKPLVQLTINN